MVHIWMHVPATATLFVPCCLHWFGTPGAMAMWDTAWRQCRYSASPWLLNPLLGLCPLYLYSNTTQHQGTRVKKLCAEQWFDSRNCQMASLLCSMRSPGGSHKHLFPLFAATTVILKSTNLPNLTEDNMIIREQYSTGRCIRGEEIEGSVF